MAITHTGRLTTLEFGQLLGRALEDGEIKEPEREQLTEELKKAPGLANTSDNQRGAIVDYFADNSLTEAEQIRLHYFGMNQADYNLYQRALRTSSGNFGDFSQTKTGPIGRVLPAKPESLRPVVFAGYMDSFYDGHTYGYNSGPSNLTQRLVVVDRPHELNSDNETGYRVLVQKHPRGTDWHIFDVTRVENRMPNSRDFRNGRIETRDGTEINFFDFSPALVRVVIDTENRIAWTGSRSSEHPTSVEVVPLKSDDEDLTAQLATIPQPTETHSRVAILDGPLAGELATNALPHLIRAGQLQDGEVKAAYFQGQTMRADGYLMHIASATPNYHDRRMQLNLKAGEFRQGRADAELYGPTAIKRPQYTAYVDYNDSHRYPYTITFMTKSGTGWTGNISREGSFEPSKK